MRFLLVGSTFVVGACGLIYEYTLSVLGNHLIGSSHEEIFIIIGLMMFAMGMGAGLQQYVKRHLFEKFILLELVLGLVGGFSATVIYMAFIHTESYRVILYGFALLIGVLIGMEIPLIIRINGEHKLDLKANLAEILSMDYVGALAGALVFTYVLLTRFELARIGFLLGLVNTAVALLGFLLFRRLVPRKPLMGVVTLLITGLLVLGFLRADEWTRYAEQRYYRDPIVSSLTTPYQHLVLTRRDDRLCMYINGHLQFSSRDEHIYHEMLVHPAMHLCPRPRSVLILGGGDGLALREVLKYPDVESVHLVDLDKEVVRFAMENEALVKLNRGALHDSRVHVIESGAVTPGVQAEVMQSSQRTTQMFASRRHPVAEVHVLIMDADRFVRELDGRYDVVLIDLPDPDALELAKLYSVDFYSALRERLTPHAIVAVQATSPYYARRVFLCIGETLRSAGMNCLPLHENVPSFGEWGWYLAWSSGARGAQPFERLEDLQIETRYLTPALLKASFEFSRDWLDPDDEVQPNTLMNPVIIDYFRNAWKGVP